MAREAFLLEALVDFPDDALVAGRALVHADIEAMMARLAALGVRRVSWGYYGDGHGGFFMPAGYREDYQGGWSHCAATYHGLRNPLKVAVEAGHRHGLEVYAYFKPYETGAAMMFPEGSPQAMEWGRLPAIGGYLTWLDPFVVGHPHLRIRRREDDGPPAASFGPVCTIRLTKRDDSPTRITRERLQVWVSARNYRYERAAVDFALRESVEPSPREVRDAQGRLLTRQGQPVRVLTLSGLDTRDRYVLVTTDFVEGPADFTNAGTALVSAADAEGREMQIVVATGGAIWAFNLVDFRNGGLMFDYGWGGGEVALDEPNKSGRKGFIAFARGRNQYLPGALCETEPEVRTFWLSCLEEMIDAGVDGVDFREENHSTHTDFPEDYGFNPAVREACARAGRDVCDAVASVRGDAYTEFLRECKRRLAECGRRMRYNLQVDFFRPDPPAARLLAYPANIDFQWRRWIDERLMDEAILRFYHLPFDAVFEDAVAREMVERCRNADLPICVNRYIGPARERLPDEVKRVRDAGCFGGFILYETYSSIRFGAEGQCSVDGAPVLAAAREAQAPARGAGGTG